MKSESILYASRRRLLGNTGLVLLLMIIPVKLFRILSVAGPVADLAPSVLGSAGLSLILVSGPGRLAGLSVGQAGLLAAAVSGLLELVQMLPRPGLCAKIHYTFDIRDLISSFLSAAVAAVLAGMVLRQGEDRS